MKTVVFEQCGEPAEVLQLKDIPVPKPARGEVRVRMLVSPINPSDILHIRGEYGKEPQFPATPGFEGVGIVEESGGGILGWRVNGKRVAVLNGRGGNWSEQVIIPAKQAVPVPEDLNNTQAATFFVNPASALVMTQYVLKIPRGGWLLQSAANGALGRMIISLGKDYGYRTINLVRREETVAELKALGADEVLCCAPEDVPEKVLEITDGRGVGYAIDPVGGEVGEALAASLGRNGYMLVYGTLTENPIRVHPRTLMAGQSRIEGFWLSVWAQQQGPLKMLSLFRKIKKLFKGGVISTDVAKTFALEDVAKAVQESEAGGRSGKVILRIADDA